MCFLTTYAYSMYSVPHAMQHMFSNFGHAYVFQELLSRKRPGYYQGAASKWRKSSELFKWEVICQRCPKVAEKYDEVPNWLRSHLELPGTAKGPSHTKVTKDIYLVVDRIVEEAARDGFELTIASIEEVLADAIEAYNCEVEKWRKVRQEADLKAVNALMEAGGTEADVARLVDQQNAEKASWPHPVNLAKTPRALNQLALSFASKYGFGMYRQDKPTRHLPRDHPQVQHVMDYIRLQLSEGKVDPRLCANFDQVWSCLYEPMRRCLWKNGEAGEKDSLAAFPKRQRMRAEMQRHFGETVQEPTHVKNAKWNAKLADVCGYGGINTVVGWRSCGCFCIFLIVIKDRMKIKGKLLEYSMY